MNLKYSEQEEAFRLEVRDYMEANVPHEIRNSPSSRTTIARSIREPFYQGLIEKGWMCPKWPTEHGGPGFSLAEQVIFHEEAGRVGAPNMDLGVVMVGPVLMRYGRPDQKTRFLSKMASAEEMWCQGFSEPNAGSDLAALATTATEDGDDFVLNGQKIWTSNGHESDWMFALVRTDSSADRPQKGISFILLDMKTPGIKIHPIHQITDSSNFSEVFFQDVRVPKSNVVGELNQGWEIAKFLLTHERVGVFSGDLIQQTLLTMIEQARGQNRDGRPLSESASWRQTVADCMMQIDATRYLGYRNTTRLLRGEAPGPETSVVKSAATETFQRVCELATEVQGPKSVVWDDENYDEFTRMCGKVMMYARSFTIAGGTSEIQRNIIAERVLGMPR